MAFEPNVRRFFRFAQGSNMLLNYFGYMDEGRKALLREPTLTVGKCFIAYYHLRASLRFRELADNLSMIEDNVLKQLFVHLRFGDKSFHNVDLVAEIIRCNRVFDFIDANPGLQKPDSGVFGPFSMLLREHFKERMIAARFILHANWYEAEFERRQRAPDGYLSHVIEEERFEVFYGVLSKLFDEFEARIAADTILAAEIARLAK